MAFELNREEINQRLNELLDRIVSLAKADDVISSDEEELIRVIRTHIHSFDTKLLSLAEEHRDINQVTSKVKDTFEEAIEAAAKQAKRDGTITADELILIDRLAKSLRNEDISSFLK